MDQDIDPLQPYRTSGVATPVERKIGRANRTMLVRPGDAEPRFAGPRVVTERAPLAVQALPAAELIEDQAGLLALQPEWDALFDAMGAARGPGFNPFMQWTWMWNWWRTYSTRRSLPQPTYALHVLVLRDRTGTARAIVPFVRARWSVGPVSFSALRLFGFGSCSVDLRSPLVWPRWEVIAADALADALGSSRMRRADLTILDGLPDSSPFTERLADRATEEAWTWGPAVPSYVLSLPATWEAFRSGLRGHLRKSVRHGYNSLARDGHAWDFEVVEDPDAIPGALADFFRLHAQRAASRMGPRHMNYYARAAKRAVLRSVAETMTPQGSFVVCRLRIAGQVVAVRIVLVGDDAIYLHDAGADVAWARYAVATTLTSECLRWAISRGVQWAHLGTGKDPAKARWRGEERVWRRLEIPAPTLPARAFAFARHLPRRALELVAVMQLTEMPSDLGL